MASRSVFASVEEYRISLAPQGYDSIDLYGYTDGSVPAPFDVHVDLRFGSPYAGQQRFSDSVLYWHEWGPYERDFALLFLKDDDFERYRDLVRNEEPVKMQIVWDNEVREGDRFKVTHFFLSTRNEPVGDGELGP